MTMLRLSEILSISRIWRAFRGQLQTEPKLLWKLSANLGRGSSTENRGADGMNSPKAILRLCSLGWYSAIDINRMARFAQQMLRQGARHRSAASTFFALNQSAQDRSATVSTGGGDRLCLVVLTDQWSEAISRNLTRESESASTRSLLRHSLLTWYSRTTVERQGYLSEIHR